MIIPGQLSGRTECSRSGCREEPGWQIVWRNPKIHAEDKRKIWLSCPDHRDFFESYLSQRGFPVAVESFPGSET